MTNLQGQFPKPLALVRLPEHACRPAFEALKEEFLTDDLYAIDLTAVDCIDAWGFQSPAAVAALVMRKLQLLHHVSQPEVVTTNAIVMGLLGDVGRSLDQLTRRCSPPRNLTVKESCALVYAASEAVGELMRNSAVVGSDQYPDLIVELFGAAEDDD